MNKVIGQYVLKQKIGAGQYGNVYRGEHTTTSQSYAVKIMGIEQFKQTPKLSQFIQNQIGALSKIQHPNIIKFIELIKKPDSYIMVYEYCNGGSLGQIIKRDGKIPQSEAIPIFNSLRLALAVLDQSHILHRDLKPDNVFFHNEVVKLGDFGFCKDLKKEKAMTETMVGSPIFMAPEVLKGQPYATSADVWSLGVLLFQMLYGFCPFEEKSIAKLVSLIDKKLISFPHDVEVSSGVKDVILRMLTPQPEQRITAHNLAKLEVRLDRVVSKIEVNYRTLAKFIRTALIYLTETLDSVTREMEEVYLLRTAFFIWKMINSIHRDTSVRGVYWINLKVEVESEEWQDVIEQELKLAQPYGQILKEALAKYDISLKTKVELENVYFDTKYYFQTVKKVQDSDLKMSLFNCLLYYRHFTQVIEKKIPDVFEPKSDNMTLPQKEDACLNYVRYE